MEFILDEKGYKTNRKVYPIKYVIENNCWICISHAKNQFGYNRICRNKKTQYMHRYIYELYNGDIPDNYVVMHKCDNPKCINPEHLIIGTHLDNMKDRDNKFRGRDKLNSNEKEQIIVMLQNKIKVKDIALKFNVCLEAIYKIRREMMK